MSYSTYQSTINLSGGTTSPGSRVYHSTVNGKWVYTPNWAVNNTEIAIQFDPSTDTWSDFDTSSYPHSITRNASGVVSGKGPPGDVVRFTFDCPYFGKTYSSGGGTSSEGLSYSGTLTVNGSNLDYEVPSSSTAGTYQILSKYLPGGNFLLDIPITHVEGTASTGSAVNFDSSKQWILRSPLGDVLDSAGASPASSLKVFCNFW